MKPNKSIDGLKVRSAKTPSSSLAPNNKKPIQPKKPAKPIEITEPDKILDEAIVEDSIEISVNDDSATNSTFEKPQKITASKKPIKKSPTKNQAIEDFLSPIKSFDFNDSDSEKNMKNPEAEPEKSKTKFKKKPSKVRHTITTILLVIVIILICGVTALVLWGNDIIAKITGGQGTVLDLITFVEETYDPLKTDSNGRTNILAFGTSGYNMDGDEGNGVHDGAQLTDSIMMISLNQETGDIAMLSLPRDLKASPTCTSTGKINEIYWCHGGNGKASIDEEAKAANALMTEVGSILGVDFQYFAHLNWGSLVQIVDTLGGITITLDEDIHDYYWTEAVYDAGVEYTLNGEQALGLARARHGTTGGDFSRGSSQQKILIGIKNKVLEKELSITDLLSLASTLGDNLRTNFSLNEMKTLAHLTNEFDLESTRQISLVDYQKNIYYMTTGMINGISYVLPSAGVGNYGPIQNYVAKNLSNDPRDYEEATILILNASETPGIAATEQSSLTDDGFSNISIDDAPEGEYNTGTTIYALTSKPGTKALLEKHYNLTAKPLEELPEIISRSYDFVIIVNPEQSEE